MLLLISSIGAASGAPMSHQPALSALGSVLLLPGVNSDLMECRLWDPAADAYVAAPELADVPATVQGAYAGGCGAAAPAVHCHCHRAG